MHRIRMLLFNQSRGLALGLSVVGLAGVATQLGGCMADKDLRNYTLMRTQGAEWVDEHGVKRTDQLVAGFNQDSQVRGYEQWTSGTGRGLMGVGAVLFGGAAVAGELVSDGAQASATIINNPAPGFPGPTR